MTTVTDAALVLSERLARALDGRVVTGESLAPFTTYHLGGPAAVFVEAASPSDLDRVAQHWDPAALPLLVVGRGSNLLVADEGFPGLVLHLGAGFTWVRLEGEVVRAGGGLHMPQLARWAAREGRHGLQFGVAVPGSVGGAVRMNAGAHGAETKDVLADADVVDLRDGTRQRFTVDDLGLGYRRSALADGTVIEAAGFHLAPGDPEALATEMREIVRWRKENQPGGEPNAGSVFANPPDDSAGRLIEAAGLKGRAVGGAQVSPKHANFFVTSPGASALDVARLMAEVRQAVRQQFDVDLWPEVRLVGDFPDEIRTALGYPT